MSEIKLNIAGVTVEMDSEKVSKAIETGELTIESDKLIAKTEDTIIYKKDEFKTFTDNLSKEEYIKGKVVGEEMAMKTMKNESGFDIEGYKDAKTFISAFKAKVIEDAGIEPSAKIKELMSDNDKLRQNFTDVENKHNLFVTQINDEKIRIKKDVSLLSFLPNEGLKVDKDITLIALKSKSGIDIDYDESGNSFITENGQMVKDPKTLQPIDAPTFIKSKLNALDLIKKPEGGAAGTNETGEGKAGSYDNFVKRMKTQNIEEGSQAFSIKLNEEITNKTVVM